MPVPLLLGLNIFFFIFHSVLILVNVFGWMFRVTLRLNLITILLTACSWGLMGLKYGLGYCLCTDWHWKVRAALGLHDEARTFNQLLVYKLTGWLPSETLTSTVTAAIFFVSLTASVWLNIRMSRERLATKGEHANLKGAG